IVGLDVSLQRLVLRSKQYGVGRIDDIDGLIVRIHAQPTMPDKVEDIRVLHLAQIGNTGEILGYLIAARLEHLTEPVSVSGGTQFIDILSERIARSEGNEPHAGEEYRFAAFR